MFSPGRGDIWVADLSPIQGHEQAGTRPCLVVSSDVFNQGLAGLVIVVPLTSRDRHIPVHVSIRPPEGGLRQPSFIMCENIRPISVGRLRERLGRVQAATLADVTYRLGALLEM